MYHDQSPNLSDIKFEIVKEEENDDASEYNNKDHMSQMRNGYRNANDLDQNDFSKIEDVSLNNGNLKKMAIQKRDTKRIRTNAKYKCIDEASEDENEPGKDMNDDDQGLSSKEQEFRETILKHESKQLIVV